MSASIKKRKVLIYQVKVNQMERHLPFEIKMPNGTHKITGITVTTSQLP